MSLMIFLVVSTTILSQCFFFLHCFSLIVPMKTLRSKAKVFSVEYRIYLSLLEFHLCMYITNTIYLPMILANSINTVTRQHQSIFHKTSSILLYELHIPALWLPFFFRLLIFAKNDPKKKIQVLTYCAWWDQNKKAHYSTLQIITKCINM